MLFAANFNASSASGYVRARLFGQDYASRVIAAGNVEYYDGSAARTANVLTSQAQAQIRALGLAADCRAMRAALGEADTTDCRTVSGDFRSLYKEREESLTLAESVGWDETKQTYDSYVSAFRNNADSMASAIEELLKSPSPYKDGDEVPDVPDCSKPADVDGARPACKLREGVPVSAQARLMAAVTLLEVHAALDVAVRVKSRGIVLKA